MLGQMATSLYVPSLPYIDDELAAGPTVVKLTMTVFLWAFALSQLIYGPLSDRYGRKPVLLLGIAIYVLGSLLCALAHDIDALLFGRFLQGVGACAGSIYRAVIRDLFDRAGGARVLAAMAAAVALGITVGAAVLVALPESNPQLDPRATRPQQVAHNYRLLLSNRTFLGTS